MRKKYKVILRNPVTGCTYEWECEAPDELRACRFCAAAQDETMPEEERPSMWTAHAFEQEAQL